MNAPNQAQEANARGLAALNNRDPALARAEFTRALESDSGAGPLWRNLAHACRQVADDSGERAALERALEIDRTDFAAQLRFAQLLERLGHELPAFQAWNGALQLAAGIGPAAPGLAAELRLGETYCASIRAKLAAAADRALEPGRDERQASENRRLAAFVGHALGERHIFPSQCAGVFYPFLPADEFFDRDHFPSFAILEAAADDIRRELAALIATSDDWLRPYVRIEEGAPRNEWSDLDGSLDWGACFLWEYGVPNEAVLARCPATASVLQRLPLARIPGRAPNAFFSLLKAHSRIPPHTGVTNTRAIVHLALDVPDGCGFRVGNETREWVAGTAFAFDDTIEHEAWNDSDMRRAVLIVDYWNPHLSVAETAALTRYFAEADGALTP